MNAETKVETRKEIRTVRFEKFGIADTPATAERAFEFARNTNDPSGATIALMLLWNWMAEQVDAASRSNEGELR
jgi:hypothetical protein